MIIRRRHFAFLLGLLLFVPKIVPAQELTYREKNPNAVSLSLLDHGVVYSLDYDRSFTKWFALGAGMSLAGSGSTFLGLFHAYGMFYPAGKRTTSLFLSAGASALTVDDSLFSTDRFVGSPFYGNAGVGVEYRKDFLFRFKINALFNGQGVLVPWPGVTFGYAF